MNAATFQFFRDFVYQHTGIALSEDKLALVSSRVQRRIRHLALENEEAYATHLKNDRDSKELEFLIDSVVTNFTDFFREREHFDFLETEIQKAVQAGKSSLRLWCAASSTGEEAYSMALSILKAKGAASLDAKILATDISLQALEKAIEGSYPIAKLNAVPEPLKNLYFQKETVNGNVCLKAEARLKEMIQFHRLNLARPPYPMKGPLDFIFLRNVMIYFDVPVRQAILAEVERLLAPGGFLLIGHTENLLGVRHSLKMISPSVFQKT